MVASAEEIVDIAFPVLGEVSFQDDFDDARSGGRTHGATDIMADKMSPILAVVDGVIDYAPTEEPSYGYMITLEGDDGYEYNYVHINNDTPGTDDGEGGAENAYVEGIVKGARVERGEHIAWVGDSGNAESVGSHVHFEIIAPDGELVNPYPSLLAAYSSYSFNPEAEQEAATSINDDQDILEASGAQECTSNTLIRTPESPTVYYCGRDGGRYIFQNEGTFFSWYDDFDDVEYVSEEQMGLIPIKGSVTYKPGVYMLKMPSVPKVYAVGKSGTLRWIPSTDIAEELHGKSWASYVHDLPESFYPAYQLGENVEHD